MLDPEHGLFDPDDLSNILTAHGAALVIASDHDGPFSDLPGRDLRRRLVAAVLKEARSGVREVHALKALALRDLCAMHARKRDEATAAPRHGDGLPAMSQQAAADRHGSGNDAGAAGRISRPVPRPRRWEMRPYGRGARIVESTKPVAAEQMAAKHPKEFDDRKVPEKLGGSAKSPTPDKGRKRPGSDLGPKHKS